MLISDKTMIELFHNYYKLAKSKNSNNFTLRADKLNKRLGIKFNEAACKGFVEFFRLFRGMYRLFDLIDMRYDKKSERYKCEVDFVKDLDPSSPGHRKRGRKLFSPKLYWRHLFPRYDNKKVTIILEPYHY